MDTESLSSESVIGGGGKALPDCCIISTRKRDRFLSNCRIRSFENESSIPKSCGIGSNQSLKGDGVLDPATEADMP